MSEVCKHSHWTEYWLVARQHVWVSWRVVKVYWWMSGSTLNRVFELQCMVARLQTLASLECIVLASSPYTSWWPCAIQPTVYAVTNLLGVLLWLLGISSWLLGNRKQNLLEPAAGEFPALLASDLYSIVTYIMIQQQTINMKCNFHRQPFVWFERG